MSDSHILPYPEGDAQLEPFVGTAEQPPTRTPRSALFCVQLAAALVVVGLCSMGPFARGALETLKTGAIASKQGRADGNQVAADLVAAGAGCANWQDSQIGPTVRVAASSECRMRCMGEPECSFWNFYSRIDGACSDPNHQGDCVLMRHNCELAQAGCWDLYRRPVFREEEASAHAAIVFKWKTGGVSCFRIPAVVRTPAGRLVAFAEARFDDLCMDQSSHKIAVSFSDDSGVTWSPFRYAVGSEEKPVCNPYPIALRNGKIVLIYAKHPSQGWDGLAGGGTGMVTSIDGGATWSLEVDVSTDFGPAAGSQPGPGAGVALLMGGGQERLLVVSHKGAYQNDFVTYSDDEGKSWKTLEQTFPKMDEATIADLGGGEVLLAMRHEGMAEVGRALSRSSDYGMTWGPIEFNHQLPSALCEASMLHHMGATYIAGPLANDPEQFWIRKMVTLRKSTDGGSTWGRDKLVYMHDTNGYTSLVASDLIFPGDGHGVGILYETFEGIYFSTTQP